MTRWQTPLEGLQALRSAALARRQQTLPVVQRYVDKWLAPRISHQGRLTAAPSSQGIISLVYYLVDEAGKRLVLHVEPECETVRLRAAAHRRFQRRGIPTPVVVFRDLRRSVLREFGFGALVQTWQEGEPYVHCGAREAAALAGNVYARLHGHTSWRWPRCRLSKSLQRKVNHFLRKYESEGFPAAAEVRRWFSQVPRQAWRQQPRLCHGDANGYNVLIHDGKAALIDLDMVKYCSAPSELAYLKHWLLGHDPVQWDAFYAQYLRMADRRLRAEVSAALPLGRAEFHLCGAVADRHTASELHVERLLETVCQRPAARAA